MYIEHDEDTPLYLKERYASKYSMIINELNSKSLIHSVMNKQYYPTNNYQEKVFIRDQFLMRDNVILQLSDIPSNGVQYLDVIYLAPKSLKLFFKSKYLNELVEKFDGIKVASSNNFIDLADKIQSHLKK